jgi:hypothetical protein
MTSVSLIIEDILVSISYNSKLMDSDFHSYRNYSGNLLHCMFPKLHLIGKKAANILCINCMVIILSYLSLNLIFERFRHLEPFENQNLFLPALKGLIWIYSLMSDWFLFYILTTEIIPGKFRNQNFVKFNNFQIYRSWCPQFMI